MPEGRVFFTNEPILRVTAPMPQAQLVETRVINLLHFQTLIASKAARLVLAAPGKLLIDFGLRRAHGAEAGLLAARTSYMAGFAGSATTLAEHASASRASARWRTRSSRRTTAKAPLSNPSPARGRKTSPCCWTPTTRRSLPAASSRWRRGLPGVASKSARCGSTVAISWSYRKACGAFSTKAG
jgi:hypothetical protein